MREPTSAGMIAKPIQVLFSVVLLWHFGAVLVLQVSTPSGPWPAGGSSEFAMPMFAAQQAAPVAVKYLNSIHLAHRYHFAPRNFMPAVKLEAILRDKDGKEIARQFIPDPNGTRRQRHYQQLLADQLEQNIPVAAPAGEYIPAPDQPVPTRMIWQAQTDGPAKLVTIAEHLIPRDQENFAPGPRALLTAQSIGRQLLRRHGADSCEILRSTLEVYGPQLWLNSKLAENLKFEPIVVSFGVVHAANP